MNHPVVDLGYVQKVENVFKIDTDFRYQIEGKIDKILIKKLNNFVILLIVFVQGRKIQENSIKKCSFLSLLIILGIKG